MEWLYNLDSNFHGGPVINQAVKYNSGIPVLFSGRGQGICAYQQVHMKLASWKWAGMLLPPCLYLHQSDGVKESWEAEQGLLPNMP